MSVRVFLLVLLTSWQVHAQSNLEKLQEIPDDYDSLIAYVANQYQDKAAIAEFLYYWTARNIQYDHQLAFESTNNPLRIVNQEALQVFESRKAVCSGYSRLYKLLLNEFDIVCEIVEGRGKSKEGLMQNETLTISHSWNAFQLNDEWFLVDVTWASSTRIADHITPFYFRTPPQQFIYTHLPSIDYWQLLDRKVSAREFEKLPEVNAGYYDLGFGPIRPNLQKTAQTYKLTVGLPKKWKPVISVSRDGMSYENVKYKRKKQGDHQELLFEAYDPGPFIIRFDASQPLDWPQKMIRTHLAFMMVR